MMERPATCGIFLSLSRVGDAIWVITDERTRVPTNLQLSG